MYKSQKYVGKEMPEALKEQLDAIVDISDNFADYLYETVKPLDDAFSSKMEEYLAKIKGEKSASEIAPKDTIPPTEKKPTKVKHAPTEKDKDRDYWLNRVKLAPKQKLDHLGDVDFGEYVALSDNKVLMDAFNYAIKHNDTKLLQKVKDKFIVGKKECEIVNVAAPLKKEGVYLPPATAKDRKIDPESLAKLEAYLKTLPQTVDIHLKKGDWTEERTGLHNKIKTELTRNLPCEVPEKPIALLTGGMPGSGKSTYLKRYDWAGSDKVFRLDSDLIKEYLPEYKGYNAFQVHEESSYLFGELLDQVGKGCEFDLILDGTMQNFLKYVTYIKKLKKYGYRVFIVFTLVSKEVSIERALKRYKSNGRFVPIHVIEDMFKQNPTAVFDEIKTMVDGYILLDNSGKEPVVIEEKNIDLLPTERRYEIASKKPALSWKAVASDDFRNRAIDTVICDKNREVVEITKPQFVDVPNYAEKGDYVELVDGKPYAVIKEGNFNKRCMEVDTATGSQKAVVEAAKNLADAAANAAEITTSEAKKEYLEELGSEAKALAREAKDELAIQRSHKPKEKDAKPKTKTAPKTKKCSIDAADAAATMMALGEWLADEIEGYITSKHGNQITDIFQRKSDGVIILEIADHKGSGGITGVFANIAAMLGKRRYETLCLKENKRTKIDAPEKGTYNRAITKKVLDSIYESEGYEFYSKGSALLTELYTACKDGNCEAQDKRKYETLRDLFGDVQKKLTRKVEMEIFHQEVRDYRAKNKSKWSEAVKAVAAKIKEENNIN